MDLHNLEWDGKNARPIISIKRNDKKLRIEPIVIMLCQKIKLIDRSILTIKFLS